MSTLMNRIGHFTVVLSLVVAIAAMGVAGVSAASSSGTTVSVALPANGGWAAYTFAYPGDGSAIGITMTYSPVVPSTEQVAKDITLDAYGPDSPPPDGTPIGSAHRVANTPGTQYWELASSVAGTYTLIVHNWDAAGNTETITLTSTDVASGGPGPALTLVASSVSSAPASSAPAQAQSAPPAASPTKAAPAAATTVSVALPANGGWAAYTFAYPGDGSAIGITMTYSPVVPSTEQVAKDITLDAYGPDSPPPDGTPIGSAHRVANTPGTQYWELASSVAGTYTLIVHNWDAAGNTETITLTSTDVASGGPGPALTLVASGH